MCNVLPSLLSLWVGWLVQVGDLEFLPEADDHSQQRRASAAPPSPSASGAAGAAAAAAGKEVRGAGTGAARSSVEPQPEQAQPQTQALSLLARPDVKSAETERSVRMHAFPPRSLVN
jgi:hypothetical protein